MLERWVDIEDPREQFEAAFGLQLEPWQWDYVEHLRRGERLVPKGQHGSQWIIDDRFVTKREELAWAKGYSSGTYDEQTEKWDSVNPYE